MAQAARLGEAFNLANRLHAFGADYQPKYVSESGGLVTSSSGVRIAVDPLGDEHARRAIAFFHLHGERASVRRDEALHRRLSEIRRHARWIVDAMDLPALAAASVPTRRNGSASHAQEAPHAVSGATELQQADTAVFTAVLDMFHADLGDSVAEEIASNLLRPVEQRYVQSMWAFRELSASPPIRMSAQRLRVQSVERVSIAQIARAAAMSERNFLRRFKKEIGVTPTEFVQHVRLERACHMLVHTMLPADKVARRTGFGSGERLAKLFRQRMLMSPTEFRVAERERMLANDAALPAPENARVNGVPPPHRIVRDDAHEKTGRISVKSPYRDFEPRFPCASSPPPLLRRSARRK
ncbi:helix-turn-helix domain-containing protein [Burkholderia multivorans]|uniref:helix-turn-helix domain-containing protein n=1 Tax=Burkholderia multivorans TaxID=87883 RepID=UPI001C222B86|nr:helix-turn-helix domain-containing protein [Burkholderia multivorans]MBU9693495.1 helix-turn-helix domain-containing protein [Burkholderia multivorans]